MREVMELSSPQQVKALAHPLRIQILTELAQPRTNLQVAQAVSESPSKTFFHMRELDRAGLIEMVEARPKGGVVEKFYQATARSFRLNADMLGTSGEDDVVSAALMHAYRQYQQSSRDAGRPRATVVQETLRLTPAQLDHVRRLINELQSVIDESRALESDAEAHDYGLTVLLHEG